MFGSKILKFTGIVTLCFFMFFVFTVETGLAQSKEEDSLSKAKRLYQEGDYEASITLLSQFIEKLKAMVEQKKNVAEAFYLLAKIYFEVGDDKKVDENLKKVFVTFPTFSKDEPNFSFKERVEKVRGEMNVETEKFTEETPVAAKPVATPKPRTRMMEQPQPPKKKKFPVLLVVGGVIVVAALAVLLLKKKADSYDIRGDWTVRGQVRTDSFRFFINYSGSKTNGSFVDNEGDVGTYTVNDKTVHFEYTDYAISFDGNFSNKDAMSGVVHVAGDNGTWSGSRGINAALSLTQVAGAVKAQNRKK